MSRDMTDLHAAIALIKARTPADEPWTALDVTDTDASPTDIDAAIATVLNAVVSGDLMPRPAGYTDATAHWLASARTMGGPDE